MSSESKQSSFNLSPALKVITVPCRSDNYTYLLIDTINHVCAAVDPFDPDKTCIHIYLNPLEKHPKSLYYHNNNPS